MTTFALALIFSAALMIYCGVKGKSLSAALTGHSVDGGTGSLLGGGSSSSASSGTAAGTVSSPRPAAGSYLQTNQAPR